MSDDIKYKNVLCISLVSNISDFGIGFSMVVSVWLGNLEFIKTILRLNLRLLKMEKSYQWELRTESVETTVGMVNCVTYFWKFD